MENNDQMRKRFAGLIDPQMPAQPPQRLEDMTKGDKLAGAQRGVDEMTIGAPIPKPPARGNVVQPNIVNQNESDLIRAAQQKLLQGVKPIPEAQTAEGQNNDKLDWLENAAQFDDPEAKAQLQKLAPDRFQKLFGQ